MMWISVALGGAAGAVLRYGLAQVIRGPLGTLSANVIGCFAMGVLYVWLAQRGDVSDATRAFLMTGLLGALTTYSTFSLETLQMWQSDRIGAAMGYAGGTLLLSLAACAAGAWLARSI